MIITDENDALAAKRAYTQVPTRPEEEEENAAAGGLPAYSVAETSTQAGSNQNQPVVQQNVQPTKSSVQFPSNNHNGPRSTSPLMPYHGYDGYYSLTHLQMQRQGRREARRRFCKALSLAIVFYILFCTFAQSIYQLVRRRHGSWVSEDWERGRPWAEDGNIVECADEDDWSPEPILHKTQVSHQINTANSSRWPLPYPTYVSYYSFNLPTSADLLYFLSRGTTYGSIKIDTYSPQSSSRRGGSEDDVIVKIAASYYSDDALRMVTACHLKRKTAGGLQHGVGVYGPPWSRGGYTNRVRFDLTVLLPASPSSPLLIKSLQTDFANFAHEIADLKESVVFGKLDVKTSNSNVNSGGILSRSAVIRSSNSPITGFYNVSDSLKLLTSNGGIKADVVLHSNGKNPASVIDAELRTSNGAINVPITLSTTVPSPNYTITSTTSNMPIMHDIVYTSPPPPPYSPSLTFSARTSNNPASLRIDSAYEGSFDLSTSNSHVEVDTGIGRVEDPWGGGRQREVVFRSLPGPRSRYASGEARWGKSLKDKERAKRGKIEIKTSNAFVNLKLY